jgi:hypothetical protein
MTAGNTAFDLAATFSDMQWFMFRQRNVVYYAAFSRLAYDPPALVRIARTLAELAPQLRMAWRGGAGGALSDDLLVRLVAVHPVDDFAGFPEAAIDDGQAVTADPGLPLFRVHAFVRREGPDAKGRAAFLLVRVSHALVEGADSALLSRSRPAAHPVSRSNRQAGPLLAATAGALGGLAAFAHLAIANALPPRPGPFVFATRAYPRRLFADLARDLRVRQRALFFALVMHALFGAGTAAGRRRISATYSAIDAGGGAHRDTYMRMRMRFALFANAPDFAAFARGVEAQLARSEGRECGFNAEFTAAGLHLHRRLSRLLPFAYGPRLFAFLPYDVVIGLIPPHRLAGALTEGLMEPVYCGATTPGANACVIVPGRELVSFNFYIQHERVPNLAALDALLAGHVVNPGFSSPGPNH